MLIVISEPASQRSIVRMAEIYGDYIKVAVDIEQQILAGGGESHYDCEQALLETGSAQQNIWAATLNLRTQEITYDSMVNLRPLQNRSMIILDDTVRKTAFALSSST